MHLTRNNFTRFRLNRKCNKISQNVFGVHRNIETILCPDDDTHILFYWKLNGSLKIVRLISWYVWHILICDICFCYIYLFWYMYLPYVFSIVSSWNITNFSWQFIVSWPLRRGLSLSSINILTFIFHEFVQYIYRGI